MSLTRYFLLISFLMVQVLPSYAGRCRGNTAGSCPGCCVEQCCGQMGGIQYCDSSSGRYVCNNGYYSSCYCTRHAVMDLQNIQGCCLWQGGVSGFDPGTGTVMCADGSTSAVCSFEYTPEAVASW